MRLVSGFRGFVIIIFINIVFVKGDTIMANDSITMIKLKRRLQL